jgi:Polyketide cyclase / dehydrase and lipid transport
MPRWWPGVTRMEGVEGGRFTQVFQTKRRRAVRADFRVLVSEPPGVQHSAPGHRSWSQDVAGTPFETVLQESITEVVVEPAPEGTRVTIAQRQRLRGYSRTGTLVVRRATLKRLDEALDGLARLFPPPSG